MGIRAAVLGLYLEVSDNVNEYIRKENHPGLEIAWMWAINDRKNCRVTIYEVLLSSPGRILFCAAITFSQHLLQNNILI